MNLVQKMLYGSVGVGTAMTTFAQGLKDQRDPNEGLIGVDEGDEPIEGFLAVIETILTFLFIIALVYALYGGFLILTAGGNDENVTKGRKVIIYAIIGVVIIFLANTIISIVFDALQGTSTTQ